jgi:hypothetical protein
MFAANNVWDRHNVDRQTERITASVMTVARGTTVDPILVPHKKLANGRVMCEKKILSAGQWRFVFIIWPNMTLTVPPPQKLTLRDLSPYSAVVNVESVQVQHRPQLRGKISQ